MNEYERIKRHLEALKLNEEDSSFASQLDDCVQQLMKEHKYTVDRLSSLMCMSRSKLRRHTLKHIGIPPLQYVMFRRMQESGRLMTTNPTLSISQIARVCGFYDHSHFTHTFEHFFGENPSGFVKKR